MRRKLTAFSVSWEFRCILEGSEHGWPHFSGSCHFSYTLFSLTFSLWPPCYRATQHVAWEQTPRWTQIMQPPIGVLCSSTSFSILCVPPSFFFWPQSSSSFFFLFTDQFLYPTVLYVCVCLYVSSPCPPLPHPLLPLQACKNTCLLQPGVCVCMHVFCVHPCLCVAAFSFRAKLLTSIFFL